MHYRFITTRKLNGYDQMAMDEAILDAVSMGESPETIRFFDFKPIAITVGRLQRLNRQILNGCKRNQVDVVRRLTGGRLVVHAGDFTFSLAVKAANPIFGGSTYDTNRAVSKPFLGALSSIGIPVSWSRGGLREKGSRKVEKSPLCFDSTARYELSSRGRKVLGVSQYRRGDTILVQGTIILRKPYEVYRNLFGDLLSFGGFTSIEEERGESMDFGDFAKAISYCFETTYKITLHSGAPSDDEIGHMKALVRKYRSAEWGMGVLQKRSA